MFPAARRRWQRFETAKVAKRHLKCSAELSAMIDLLEIENGSLGRLYELANPEVFGSPSKDIVIMRPTSYWRAFGASDVIKDRPRTFQELQERAKDPLNDVRVIRCAPVMSQLT